MKSTLTTAFITATPPPSAFLISYPCYLFSEKAKATHSSALAWKMPWAEEPGGLQSMGSRRVGHDWATSLSRTGEGNGSPLQCSCLENPRDGGAWWAAIYGVAQSWTRLKRLSSSSSSYLFCYLSVSICVYMCIYIIHFVAVVQQVSHVRLFANPTDCSPPGSSVYGISRQEYWSKLLCPSPGDLPDPGIKPESPACQADSLPLSHLGSPVYLFITLLTFFFLIVYLY